MFQKLSATVLVMGVVYVMQMVVFKFMEPYEIIAKDGLGGKTIYSNCDVVGAFSV